MNFRAEINEIFSKKQQKKKIETIRLLFKEVHKIDQHFTRLIRILRE